jgi:hypothetical protein
MRRITGRIDSENASIRPHLQLKPLRDTARFVRDTGSLMGYGLCPERRYAVSRNLEQIEWPE